MCYAADLCMQIMHRVMSHHRYVTSGLSGIIKAAGSIVSEVLKTTLLCRKAAIKASTWKGEAGAEAVSKAQKIKSFGWQWPVAGGTMDRRSTDAHCLCTVRAVCEYTGRMQRSYGLAIAGTCWEGSILLGMCLAGWGADLHHGGSSAAF